MKHIFKTGKSGVILSKQLFIKLLKHLIRSIRRLVNRDILSRKLQTTFRKFYGHHADFVHKVDTSVSRMLNGLFTNCGETPLGSSWFYSFVIIYIHYILLNLSVLGLCLRINDSGLFAWISLGLILLVITLSAIIATWIAVSS